MFNDPKINPNGTSDLPIWHITSMELWLKDHVQPATWWFELETQEGVFILVGESGGIPQVNVSGPGYVTRNYTGEAAAERVAFYRTVWKSLCKRTGDDPSEERKIII